jgi:hypothetical protein
MRTEEGVVWALGVEIYELSTYHFPHIEVSTFLCEACKKLINSVCYEKSLLHGSLGSLHHSSLTCRLCLLAYQEILQMVVQFCGDAHQFSALIAERGRCRGWRSDTQQVVITGEPRPYIQPSLASDIKCFYLSEYVISLGSKDSLVRRRDRRFDLPMEIFPSAILQTMAYSGTCLLRDTFDLVVLTT